MTQYQIAPEIRVGQISELLPTYVTDKTRSILIVASESVLRIDVVRAAIEVISSLTDAVVHRIESEAPVSQVQTIADQQETVPDLIVAIGGGSAIDAGKALSVAFGGTEVSDMLHGKAAVPREAISVLAIPTTAGTGAEVSQGAILTDPSTGTKSGIRGRQLQPQYVLIDSRLHQYAPSSVVAEAGFDCLTHAVETFCSTSSNAIVRYQSVHATKIVLSRLDQAVHDKDQGSLEELAIAAMYMGINLIYSRTCLPHRIQYVIGPMTKTSHAQGLIALYRGWLPLIAAEPIFCDLSARLGYTSEQFCDEIDLLKERVGVNYRLADFGVRETDVARITGAVSGSVELDPCYRDAGTLSALVRNAI